MLLTLIWFSVEIMGKMAADLTGVYLFKNLKTNIKLNCV